MYQLPPLETLCPEYRFMTGGEVWVHKLVGEKSDVASCEEVAIWAPNLLPRRGTGAAAQRGRGRGRGRHLWAKDLCSRQERQPRTVDLIAPNWRGSATARSGRDCLKPGFALTAM